MFGHGEGLVPGTSQSQVTIEICSLEKYLYHLYRWSAPGKTYQRNSPSDWSSSQAGWGEGNNFARVVTKQYGGKWWRATPMERAKNIMKSLQNCNNIKLYRFYFYNY